MSVIPANSYPSGGPTCVSYPPSPSQPYKAPSDVCFLYPNPPAPQTMYNALALGGKPATEVSLIRSDLTSFPALSLISATYAATVGSIQGPAFLSAYDGQTLSNITGLVTAKVWLLARLPRISVVHHFPRDPPHSGLLTRKPMTGPSRLASWSSRPRLPSSDPLRSGT